MTRSMKMLALCLGLAACTGGADVQVITGRVATSQGALAIRAVADNDVVTATPVRTDGSFTLTLPAGTSYRLEVLTRTGVKNMVQRSGNILRDLSFRVCQPVDPFDIGGVGEPGTDGLCMPGDASCTPCDPMTGAECEPPKPPDDPNCMPNAAGHCEPPLPPTCEPMDPNCACDIVAPDGTCCQAGDPSCGPLPCMDPGDPSCCSANGFCPPTPCDPMSDPTCEPPPPPDCDPASGNCEPPTCDPMTDPMCEPPPCADPTDPNCGYCSDPTAPGCTPPCADPTDPNCGYGCSDPMAPGCTPPCENPMDPSTCKDPCAEDPASCGCMADASGQADCWPEPQPCCSPDGTTCDPADGMAPDNVPGDFGCM
jgi:hypothetical protein